MDGRSTYNDDLVACGGAVVVMLYGHGVWVNRMGP